MADTLGQALPSRINVKYVGAGFSHLVLSAEGRANQTHTHTYALHSSLAFCAPYQVDLHGFAGVPRSPASVYVGAGLSHLVL